jgi:hypothetical protein
MEHRLFRLISMLWVGSLLSLGFIAAPVIFSTLANTTDAGTVAAQLFRIEAIIGVISALALIVIGNRFVKSGIVDYKRVRWIVAVMLACVLVGYFAIYLIESLFGIALVWRLPGAVPSKIVPKSKSAKMAAKRARS